jgi:hypothetical protein
MSIISKITGQITSPTTDVNQLSTEELEFILTALKDVTITGSQVEMFYNLVVKLQNQYVDQTK